MQIEILFEFILEVLQALFLVISFAGIAVCLFNYTKNPRRKILMVLALIIFLIFMVVAIFILPGVRWCGGCQEWH